MLEPDPYIESVTTQLTVADATAGMLEDLGVGHAFALLGGAPATLWVRCLIALMPVLNFRHEAV